MRNLNPRQRDHRLPYFWGIIGFAVTGGTIGALSPYIWGPYVCTLMLKCASTSMAAASGCNFVMGAATGGLFGTAVTPPLLDYLDYCSPPDDEEEDDTVAPLI